MIVVRERGLQDLRPILVRFASFATRTFFCKSEQPCTNTTLLGFPIPCRPLTCSRMRGPHPTVSDIAPAPRSTQLGVRLPFHVAVISSVDVGTPHATTELVAKTARRRLTYGACCTTLCRVAVVS